MPFAFSVSLIQNRCVNVAGSRVTHMIGCRKDPASGFAAHPAIKCGYRSDKPTS
jgi:hypothetical protein